LINKSLSWYSIFKAQSSIFEKNTKHKTLVIPAQAGIQCVADIFLICPCGAMDTHLRGYDELKYTFIYISKSVKKSPKRGM